MTMWLYQMSAEGWSPEQYRYYVWEGENTRFDYGKIQSEKKENDKEIRPKTGDIIVLFFAPTECDEPGIYGWGVILNFSKKWETINFRVVPPSDFMKLKPIWNNKEIKQLMNDIRGKVKQKNIFKIDRKYEEKIRRLISYIKKIKKALN